MKKKLFYSVMSFFMSVSLVAFSSMSVFASSGTFYSYRLFEYKEQRCGYTGYDLCPKCLIYYIENDDVDNLQRAIVMSGAEDAVNTPIRPDQIFNSRWYKCKFCKCNPYLTPISLIEYAFSCGSEKCVKYLLLNGGKPFNDCYDNLVLDAVISGNAALVHLAEESGGHLSIYCLYALLRLSYDMDIDNLNDFLEFMLDHDFIDTWIKDMKRLSPLSSPKNEDKAEIALGFLLLAEIESDNPELFAERILDENSPMRVMVDKLIFLSKINGKFSGCFTTLVSSTEASERPIYMFLKGALMDYILNEESDVNLMRYSVFLRLQVFCPYTLSDEFCRAEAFFYSLV